MEEIKIEDNEEKLIPLEVLDRNLVQVELIKLMVGEDASLINQLNWVKSYAKLVSEIIDNPENRELREEIAKHDYKNAAKLIKDVIMSIDYSHNKSA